MLSFLLNYAGLHAHSPTFQTNRVTGPVTGKNYTRKSKSGCQSDLYLHLNGASRFIPPQSQPEEADRQNQEDNRPCEQFR